MTRIHRDIYGAPKVEGSKVGLQLLREMKASREGGGEGRKKQDVPVDAGARGRAGCRNQRSLHGRAYQGRAQRQECEVLHTSREAKLRECLTSSPCTTALRCWTLGKLGAGGRVGGRSWGSLTPGNLFTTTGSGRVGKRVGVPLARMPMDPGQDPA